MVDDRGWPLKPSRQHRWLLLLPFVWQIGLVPFANGVTLKPFDLPFPMAWQMVGIVFATMVIALVRWLDACYDARHGSDAESQQ